MDRTVFHEGERAMQARTGALERMAEVGPRVIRDHMPQQHRDFFAQLGFVLLGAADPAGQPWATAVAGAPGFLQAPDARRLRVEAPTGGADPVLRELRPGSALGLLGIEPATRRRNRMNGRVVAADARGFEVAVELSFGNCPKYIQAREPHAWREAARPPPPEPLAALDDAARRLVAGADTFFIATAHPHAGATDAGVAQGVDVSHRGGRPGFVRADGQALVVPDFVGNSFFNTLGNLLVEPRCGLLFIDFAGGELLHLAAVGEVLADDGAAAAYPGAQRLVRFRVTGGLRRRAALPLRWSDAQLSPHLQATGAWR